METRQGPCEPDLGSPKGPGTRDGRVRKSVPARRSQCATMPPIDMTRPPKVFGTRGNNGPDPAIPGNVVIEGVFEGHCSGYVLGHGRCIPSMSDEKACSCSSALFSIASSSSSAVAQVQESATEMMSGSFSTSQGGVWGRPGSTLTQPAEQGACASRGATRRWRCHRLPQLPGRTSTRVSPPGEKSSRKSRQFWLSNALLAISRTKSSRNTASPGARLRVAAETGDCTAELWKALRLASDQGRELLMAPSVRGCPAPQPEGSPTP